MKMSLTKLPLLGLCNIMQVAKSIMDVSKLRPADYNDGSETHRPLTSVCLNAKLKRYTFPLGFHRECCTKRFVIITQVLLIPQLRYHIIFSYYFAIIQQSFNRSQITWGPGSNIRSERTPERGPNVMKNG